MFGGGVTGLSGRAATLGTVLADFATSGGGVTRLSGRAATLGAMSYVFALFGGGIAGLSGGTSTLGTVLRIGRIALAFGGITSFSGRTILVELTGFPVAKSAAAIEVLLTVGVGLAGAPPRGATSSIAVSIGQTVSIFLTGFANFQDTPTGG